jgi:hypothetical protein
MSLITIRGTPRSARQKRSNAASLTGLASSRQTRSGPGGRPWSAGLRPTAPITWKPSPRRGPLLTRISTLSMTTISGHRSGSSPAHSGSVKTSTQLATSCPSRAASRRLALPVSRAAGSRPPGRRAANAASR